MQARLLNPRTRGVTIFGGGGGGGGGGGSGCARSWGSTTATPRRPAAGSRPSALLCQRCATLTRAHTKDG